jgi:DNA-directed RNA polymerase subunit alpha
VAGLQAWVKYDQITEDAGKFIIQPLNKGLGVTLGNSLRRIMLSSIEGASMVAIKIPGITHEFTTIPNIVEDVLEIICNLKTVIFENQTSENQILKLSVTKQKSYTSSDIQCPTGVVIVNKNQHLFQVNGKADFEISIFIENGIGYRDSQSQTIQVSEDPEVILTDSSFSPVLKVNHEVEMIRVGKELDHDKLIIDVQTNGTVSSEDVIKKSVNILSDLLGIFDTINEEPEVENVQDKQIEDLKIQSILNMTVDELELSARSSNCLKRAGIENVNELLQKDMSELVQIKNFGKKSADEINSRLSQFNLSLKGSTEE